MAAVDSKFAFANRLAELGLGDLKPKFESNGWATFGDFAFATSDFQGKDPEKFEKEVVDKLLGDDKSRVPKLRRLFLQSYVLAAADLESTAHGSEKMTVTLHTADRNVRLEALKARITGFEIVGPSEPSHALVDLFASILHSGAVRYVPWEKCGSRAAEVEMEPVDPGLKLNAEATL